MRRVLSVVIFLLVVIPCLAGNKPDLTKTIVFLKIDSRVVEGRLKLPVETPADRLKVVRAQFQKAGCRPDQLQQQAVPGQTLPNVICTIPGTSDATIVIAARLDYKSKGDEAKVEWGTLELLPLLAESLYGATLRHRLVIAAFTGTDSGQAGANYYLRQLNDTQRASIKAMVDLDHIGRTPVAYAFPLGGASEAASHGRGFSVTISTPTWDEWKWPLTRHLPEAALSVHLQDMPRRADDDLAGVNDSKAFAHAGIPYISIFSPAYEMVAARPGIPMAQLRTQVVPKTLSDAYLLLCAYFVLLDRDLGKALPPPAVE